MIRSMLFALPRPTERLVALIHNPIRRQMSSKKRLDISGIYPPIATPFNQDETIANDKLQQNMEKWNKFNFKGNFKCFTVLCL